MRSANCALSGTLASMLVHAAADLVAATLIYIVYSMFIIIHSGTSNLRSNSMRACVRSCVRAEYLTACVLACVRTE